MADTALFIGFGQAARAREPQALELFDEAAQFYGNLAAQGDIDSVEPVILQPHGGELFGFFLIRGSREQIASLSDNDTFRRLNARATLVVDNFGVVPAFLGSRLAEEFDVYRGQVDAQLTAM